MLTSQISSAKSLGMGNCQVHYGRYLWFLKLFLLEILIIIDHKSCQLFSMKQQTFFIHLFWKMYAEYSILNKHRFLVIHSSKNDISLKSANSACNSVAQELFLCDNHHAFMCSGSAHFPLCHIEYWKAVYSRIKI